MKKYHKDSCPAHFCALHCAHRKEESYEKEQGQELIRWAKIVKAGTLQELEDLAGEEEALKEMVSKIKELSEEEKIELQCEAKAIHEWNVQAERQAGISEGRKAGIKEGRQQAMLQVYKNCIERGMSNEEAKAISGITEEDLIMKGL